MNTKISWIGLSGFHKTGKYRLRFVCVKWKRICLRNKSPISVRIWTRRRKFSEVLGLDMQLIWD